MPHPRAFLRLIVLLAILGQSLIAYSETALSQSQDTPRKTKKPPVYVQDRKTQETLYLDQLEPIPGCKQVGVEVTSRGMVKKCFDNIPVWKD